MKNRRDVLARIDSCCARINDGLAIIALVLVSLVLATASFRAPLLLPPAASSPQSSSFLGDEE